MTVTHIGAAEIFLCEWEFECPRDWFKLAPTDNDKVRHCGECNKPVTFCQDLGEMLALQQTNPGACVALHSSKVTTVDASTIRLGLPRS